MDRPIPSVSPLRFVVAVLALLVFALGASSSQAQDLRAYTEKIKKAVSDGDFTALKELVSQNRELARRAGVVLENDIAGAAIADDAVERERLQSVYSNLAQQFRIVYDDPVLVTRSKWIEGLDRAQLETKAKADAAYDKGYFAYEEAKKSADEQGFRDAAASYAEAYTISDSIGDHYVVVVSAQSAGNCYVDMGDWFGGVYWYQRAQDRMDEAGLPFSGSFIEKQLSFSQEYDKVKRQDLIDWKLPLDEARTAHQKAYEESLVVKLPEGEGKGGRNAETATLVPPTVADAYEWVDDTKFKDTRIDPDRVRVPWYHPGYHHGNPSLYPFATPWGAQRDDAAKPFDFLPNAVATYDGDLMVDVDGPEGKARPKELKLKVGKPVDHKFKVKYDDGSEGQQSFEIMQEPSSFKIFDTEFEYTDAQNLLVRVRAISAVTGKIRGEQVTIVDANGMRGYNEAGEDAIIIGSGRDARVEPFGRLVWFEQEDGSLYPYEVKIVQQNGQLVRSRPYQGPLAPLRVEYDTPSGEKPDFLIAQGSGENTDVFIDLMKATDRIVWVPPTTLSVHRGFFVVGSGRGESLILIGKGLSKGFKVEAGKMNVWQLGTKAEKGFWFDVKATRQGDVVKVEGASLKVYGGGGEEYFNFTGDRLYPKVTLRRDKGEGSKVGDEEMKSPKGTAGITSAQAFYPGDLIFDKVSGDGLAVQLELKHEVLGEIKSDWIEVR